jgi:hypothetical protein
MKGIETLGPVESTFKIYTNDPRNYLIEIKATANVKPVPAYVKRMSNINLTIGEEIGSFRVWPTAHSEIIVERNERLKISYKIMTDTPQQTGKLQLLSNDFKDAKYSLRYEESSGYYWLDVETEPVGEAGLRTVKISLQSDGTPKQSFDVALTLRVPAESLTFSPSVVDCGEIPLSSLKEYPTKVGRVGIRKAAGVFQIKAITSTLTFLKPEIQTMVTGSNYLIRFSTDPKSLPKPGVYEGLIHIETDDPQQAKVDVPIKITITNK